MFSVRQSLVVVFISFFLICIGMAYAQNENHLLVDAQGVTVWCDAGKGQINDIGSYGQLTISCLEDSYPDPPFPAPIGLEDYKLLDGESIIFQCHGVLRVVQNSYFDVEYGFYSYSGEVAVSCKESGESLFMPFVINGGYP